MSPRALVLLAILTSPPLLAQDPAPPLKATEQPLQPGAVKGVIIGALRKDTGYVAKLPRAPAVGTASSAIEIDTLDFRPKWTMRLRLASPDSMEIVLRCADTLPPEPRPYSIIILATGVSHADPQYLSGEVNIFEGGVRRRFFLGGTRDRVSFGPAKRGAIAGTIAVVGRRIDYEAGRGPLGPWRYRGLEGRFTTRPSRAVASAPRLTPRSEIRMMGEALDGVLLSWHGAVNGDGPLPDRSPAGVRAFVERRWRPAIEVDSVQVRGNDLWLRLRGTRSGIRCARSGNDLKPTCTR